MRSVAAPRPVELPTGASAALAVLSAGAVATAVAGRAGLVGVDGEGPVMCPFRLVTGLPCPFCGATRSVVAMGRGDWVGSFEMWPLGPLVVPVAVAVLAVLATAVLRRRRVVWPRGLLWLGAVVLLASWAGQLARGGGT